MLGSVDCVRAVVASAFGCHLDYAEMFERLRRRLRAEGRLTEIPVPDNPPSRDEVIAMLRGDAGRAFLEALEEDRKKR